MKSIGQPKTKLPNLGDPDFKLLQVNSPPKVPHNRLKARQQQIESINLSLKMQHRHAVSIDLTGRSRFAITTLQRLKHNQENSYK